MSENWYSRPILSVADTALALAFYALKLGFKEDWRFEEESGFGSCRSRAKDVN